MHYLERRSLGGEIESDVRVAELSIETGWPPSVIREQDWRDLQLFRLVQKARLGSVTEKQRRAEARDKNKGKGKR